MRAVNTLGDVYGWVNGEAGEKPEVSSLHESKRLGGFPPALSVRYPGAEDQPIQCSGPRPHHRIRIYNTIDIGLEL